MSEDSKARDEGFSKLTPLGQQAYMLIVYGCGRGVANQLVEGGNGASESILAMSDALHMLVETEEHESDADRLLCLRNSQMYLMCECLRLKSKKPPQDLMWH